MKIAIIPARGGSKRIQRKNIKMFHGKPLIAWSIEAAKKSGVFDHIIVSTDDAEISEIAKQYGAEVPFMRPEELSGDHAGTTEVIAHAIRWMNAAKWKVDAVCCIYSTPFVSAEDIKRGLKAIESEAWKFAFTVTDFGAPVFRSFNIHASGGVEMFFPEYLETRSQDLPLAMHDAGQFYWGLPQAWLNDERIFDHHSFPVVIPRWRVQDIDTLEDWERAELIHEALLLRSGTEL
ncbi:MAG: pseudaminic acid cytidylyltransferase [Gallionellaceae bacterium]